MAGDVSSAWSIWSFSAEVSLVRAFVGSGGPVPDSGFRLGRGDARFNYVPVGGPVVGRLRSDLGSGDGQAVHLFKDSSVSMVIILRRRLGALLCLVIWSFPLSGVLLFRLVHVVIFVVLTLLFPLLLVFLLAATMFVFCMMLLLISCTRLLFP